MKVNKADLLKALEVVKAGLSNNGILLQASSFAFTEGRVATYNNEISISCPVKDLDIEGAIQSEELYKLLTKLKKDEIDLEVKEGEIILSAGRIRAGLTLQTEITLPLKEIGKIEKWKDLPEDFTEGISFVSGTTSRDMSRPILTCIHINKNQMESTDGFCISTFEMGSVFPLDKHLIPAANAKELLKYKPTKVAAGKGWIHFKIENNAIFSSRIYEEDKYVDVAPHLEVEGIDITFPKSISDILEKATIFSKENKSMEEVVTISMEKNRIKIKSKSDSGWYEEEANIRYDGEEVEFFVTPSLLQNVLSRSNTCTLGANKIKFIGANWQYLAMLRTG
jgi:hypothetical protein